MTTYDHIVYFQLEGPSKEKTEKLLNDFLSLAMKEFSIEQKIISCEICPIYGSDNYDPDCDYPKINEVPNSSRCRNDNQQQGESTGSEKSALLNSDIYPTG